MIRFLTYTWITLGFVVCAKAFLLPLTVFILRSLDWEQEEALEALAMLPVLAFVGWSWLGSWTTKSDHSARSLRYLKLIATSYLALGLIGFVAIGIAFPNEAFVGLPRLGFFAVLTGAALLLFAPSVKADPSVISFYRRGLRVVSVAAPIGAIAWSLGTIPIAFNSAEARTKDEPYCILIARGTGYKAAETLFELSGHSMQALYNEMGSYFNYHAVLIVGTDSSRRAFNWSHSRKSFELLQERYYNSPYTVGRIPSCESRPHFVRTLPWF